MRGGGSSSLNMNQKLRQPFLAILSPYLDGLCCFGEGYHSAPYALTEQMFTCRHINMHVYCTLLVPLYSISCMANCPISSDIGQAI